MSIEAQQINIPGANPAPESTETYRGGPRTEAGLAVSSKNATTFGLFTYNDFILEGEETAYAQLAVKLKQELNPVGVFEEGLVDEIRRAMWRLRRCGNVESELAASSQAGGTGEDPMQFPGADVEKIQKSVDRARAQASRLRKQAMAELRELQTERQIRGEIFPDADASDLGVVDSAKVLKATIAAKRNTAMQNKLDEAADLTKCEQMFGVPGTRISSPFASDQAA